MLQAKLVKLTSVDARTKRRRLAGSCWGSTDFWELRRAGLRLQRRGVHGWCASRI